MIGWACARVSSVVLASVLASTLGCDGGPSDDDGDEGDDGPLSCVEVDPDGCAPLYAPSWDNVFTMTLQPDCASGGQSCHANAEAVGAETNGLFFADADEAHALLVADRGEATFVVPGDPSCSVLAIRLATDDPIQRMPPGLMLSEAEVCSVVQWIAAGAVP